MAKGEATPGRMRIKAASLGLSRGDDSMAPISITTLDGVSFRLNAYAVLRLEEEGSHTRIVQADNSFLVSTAIGDLQDALANATASNSAGAMPLTVGAALDGSRVVVNAHAILRTEQRGERTIVLQADGEITLQDGFGAWTAKEDAALAAVEPAAESGGGAPAEP